MKIKTNPAYTGKVLYQIFSGGAFVDAPLVSLKPPGFTTTVNYHCPKQDNGESLIVKNLGVNVALYATGLRNAWGGTLNPYTDALIVTDNAPNGVKWGDYSTGLTTSGGDCVSVKDEINLIVQGGYYGHPNRSFQRCQAAPGYAGNAQECVYTSNVATSIPSGVQSNMINVPASTNGKSH